MPRHIFGIVGEIKSGKSLVSDRLLAEYDCDYTRFSIPLGKALDALGLEQSRKNLQDISTLVRHGLRATPKGEVRRWFRAYLGSMRKMEERLRQALAVFHLDVPQGTSKQREAALDAGYGEDILAKTIAKDCEKATKEVVVVDSVRRFADIALLRRMPEFRLIYVTAPFETRCARAAAQGEKVGEGGVTAEEFRRRCDAEPEREIPEVGAAADLRIDNVGTKEDVYRALDAYLLSLDPVAYG